LPSTKNDEDQVNSEPQRLEGREDNNTTDGEGIRPRRARLTTTSTIQASSKLPRSSSAPHRRRSRETEAPPPRGAPPTHRRSRLLDNGPPPHDGDTEGYFQPVTRWGSHDRGRMSGHRRSQRLWREESPFQLQFHPKEQKPMCQMHRNHFAKRYSFSAVGSATSPRELCTPSLRYSDSATRSTSWHLPVGGMKFIFRAIASPSSLVRLRAHMQWNVAREAHVPGVPQSANAWIDLALARWRGLPG